jgi:hypothetical protein
MAVRISFSKDVGIVKRIYALNGTSVATASYNGALRDREMHWLQTYGQNKLDFHNNAYTFSSIYHDGQLQKCLPVTFGNHGFGLA